MSELIYPNRKPAGKVKIDQNNSISDGLLVDLFSSSASSGDIAGDNDFLLRENCEFVHDGSVRGEGLVGGAYSSNLKKIPSDSFTMLCAGIYYDSTPFGLIAILGRAGNSAAEKSIILQCGGVAGDIRAQVSTSTVYNTSVVASLDSGDYFNFLVTYNGAILKLMDLKNGITTSINASGLINNPTELQIAGGINQGDNWLSADIDVNVNRFLFWDRELSDAEIIQIGNNSYDHLTDIYSDSFMQKVQPEGGFKPCFAQQSNQILGSGLV